MYALRASVPIVQKFVMSVLIVRHYRFSLLLKYISNNLTLLNDLQ